MWSEALAVVGLAAACVLWGLVGRWIARKDPQLGNRVESERGCCGAKNAARAAKKDCAMRSGCQRRCEQSELLPTDPATARE